VRRFPATFRVFGEDGLYGGGVTFRPFASLLLSVEGDKVEKPDIEVYDILWEEGTDVRVGGSYRYDTVEGLSQPVGFLSGVELTGASEFLGGDYDYAKIALETAGFFRLPWRGSLRLHQVLGWGGGDIPRQSRFLPGPNGLLRTSHEEIEPGDRMAVWNVELSRRLLRSTPLHDIFPVIGKLFFDMGYAWPEEKDFESLRLVDFDKSWGIGLTWALFDFDLAFSADGGGMKENRFYFNLVLPQ
jgi:outer membrane protein assembly factor BamA